MASNGDDIWDWNLALTLIRRGESIMWRYVFGCFCLLFRLPFIVSALLLLFCISPLRRLFPGIRKYSRLLWSIWTGAGQRFRRVGCGGQGEICLVQNYKWVLCIMGEQLLLMLGVQEREEKRMLLSCLLVVFWSVENDSYTYYRARLHLHAMYC